MFQLETVGRWLIVIGLVIAGVGLLFFLAGKIPFLSRFGNLPGDIRYQNQDGRFSCYAPIVSMILLSVVLTIVINVVVRLLNR